LLVAGLPATAAYAQVQIAENLLIDLNATTYTTGSLSWTNAGTLTGDFNPDGTTPTRLVMDGRVGVLLDGADHFIGPLSTPGIEGSGTASIEVWAYQGNIRNEETLVAWARRGSVGQNMAFNYGTDDRWGAVGHWDAPDIGWGPNDPTGVTNGGRAPGTPVEGQWHHLAYTYDGTTERVYLDGSLANQDTVSLSVFGGFPIQVGAQRSNVDPFNVEPALQFSGLIGQVRVHDGVLTDAQVAQNFNTEKLNYHYSAANTYLPKASATLAKAPVHRYSFDNMASGNDGTVIPDIGATGADKADGAIRGLGAIVSNTGIDLPGGDSHTQAYLDFPNGIVSGTYNGGAGYTSASYETWLTIQTNQNWSRVMDFGTNQAGEVTGPGGDFNGTNYVIVSANIGGDPNVRFEVGGNQGAGTRDSQGNMLGVEVQIVVVYDEKSGQWKYYRNGELMESFDSSGAPNTITDVNNWLGRSNWSADANTDALFDEFRVYDYALSIEEIRGNFIAGPNLVNVPEPGTCAALLGGVGLLAGLRRRK
jgi:hypothetical protein